MRLVGLEVQGYRRLVKVKINLAGKIIAIVGPNEAGKTSLLHALARLGTGDPVPLQDITRSVEQADPQNVYLRAEYELEEGENHIFSGRDLEEEPKRIFFGRRIGGGGPIISFDPPLKRKRGDFDKAMKALRRACGSLAGTTAIAGPSLIEDDDVDEAGQDARSLEERLREVLVLLGDERVTLDERLSRKSRQLADQLELNARKAAANQLRLAVQWRRQPDIEQEILPHILVRVPRILLFGDADRGLLAEYDIRAPVAASPPRALANIAHLANLNLTKLLAEIEAQRSSIAATMINRANKELAGKFSERWRQSTITVELQHEGTVLRVFIKENDDALTTLDERSAGLRMFVALAAFVESNEPDTPPVLLIDEAETHLHYDAQADLINMLTTQRKAAQVIYTTHSPGCLPRDLGTGIRVIAPAAPGDAASVVCNAFWADHHAGFSSILLAMGAGAAAFAAPRCALVAEGPSDMILLPSLIRAATGEDLLPYQVAPGLSEAPTAHYPDLDLVAARVAFVVDGDAGGSRLRDRLADTGVPRKRIAQLDGMTLEDTVDLKAYSDAVYETARQVNEKRATRMPTGSFHFPRASAVKAWHETAGLQVPSKIAVANWLVEHGTAKPSEEGKRVLCELHREVMSILGLTEEKD